MKRIHVLLSLLLILVVALAFRVTFYGYSDWIPSAIVGADMTPTGEYYKVRCKRIPWLPTKEIDQRRITREEYEDLANLLSRGQLKVDWSEVEFMAKRLREQEK